MKKLIIGLTGGIASGKSTVAEMFEQHGFFVIDADVVARENMQKGGRAFGEIKKHFPESVRSGEIDRKELGRIVFGDGDFSKLRILNQITHPLIKDEMHKRVLASENTNILLVVPLMFESDFDDLCDKIITVSADENLRIARVMKRDNTNEHFAKNIIAAQMTDGEREELADFIIYNNDTLCSPKKDVKEFMEKLALC